MKNLAGIVAMLVVFTGTTTAADDHDEGWHWSYDGDQGPAFWVSHHEKCNGRSQSPIDIPLSEVSYNPSHGPIQFQNYDSSDDVRYTLKNNGHAIQVDVTNGDHLVTGGKLPGHYKLGQFHFHWGTDNDIGSEHLINGKQYPLEMHLVHYASQYSGIGDAKENPNGLAVVGVMFEVGNQKHEHMDIIVNNLNKVKDAGMNAQIATFPLAYLLPEDPTRYFRYSGSLTTPTCDESVVWTVLNDPVIISQEQMNAFRVLVRQSVSGSGTAAVMVNNYRPAQALNGRSIYSSFKQYQASAAPPRDASLICIVLGVVLKYLF